MKLHPVILGTVAIVGAAATMGGLTDDSQPKSATPKLARGMAVVELFTSEGCSSCPPADEFVGELAAARPPQGDDVYIIAWHVDYWDYLGWKDPFGSSAASERQRGYAERMKAKGVGDAGVYTPQLIVNGAAAMVGSDRTRGKGAIAAAKARAPAATIRLELRPAKAAGPVHIAVAVTGAPKDAECVAAWVEDDLTVKVPKGENGGRTLKHTRVVRASAHKPVADGAAEFDLTPPPGVDAAKSHIVVFVQEAGYGVIVGAAEARPVSEEEAKAKK